ncbi:MFS transporter [Acaricomes phytoseiuli]|uniref:MFS transporter n=1 Tax=Acaricomes phytoseiuli TaxID=291968 RepID=UPI000399B680|nr:MFS transporter [Acaricomes phytoseiuli]
MGGVLLALAIGSLLALPTAGLIAQRINVVRTIRLGAAIAVLGTIVMARALAIESVPVIIAGLFFLGIGMGLWNVAQNLEGAAVERLQGRNIMSQFHAAFSGGAFLGALLGAGMSLAGVPLSWHLLLLAALIAVVVGLSTRRFLPASAHQQHSEAVPVDAVSPHSAAASSVPLPPQRSAWREPRTLLVGLVVLGAALTEGSANDWLAKATVDGFGQAEWAGALMYALFIASMTSVRLLGGRLLDRWGRVWTLYTCLSSALAGLLLFIFAPQPVVGDSRGDPLGSRCCTRLPHRDVSGC